jgi:endonuclease YncB( thermonuclease family)
VVLLVVVALVAADRGGWLLVEPNEDYERYHGQPVTVLRVIDGDTIDVDVPDDVQDKLTTHVRLWGIDCPEVARGEQPAEPYADDATEFMRERIEGGTVVLFLETHQTRDKYQRLLAHIEGPGSENLNAALLKAGLAREDDRWTHSLLLQYDLAERAGRVEKRGMWKEDTGENGR